MNFNWEPGEEGIVDLGNMHLEAVCYGPAPDDAPTIVMLHEGLGCVSLWRDFPQKLAAETGFGVFVYSRAGYGSSSPTPLPRPLDYMTIEATSVLPKVLDAIGFQSGILLGHSDGASIAALYLGNIEDFRVRGIVLMAPHFFTEEAGLESIRSARSSYEKGDLKVRLAKYHKNVDNAFYGWCDAWCDEKFRDWNISDVIDYFRVPVLAIQGADDQYGTLAQIQEIESRIYSPVDVEILQDCKHSPHLEAPDETLIAIVDFAMRLERLENEVVDIHPA